MIGQLINQFDNQQDNSVKAFNELFKVILDFPENSEVEIGEILVGQRRELFINGKSEIVSFYPEVESFLKPVVVEEKPQTYWNATALRNEYILEKDGIEISFKNIKKVVAYLKTNLERVQKAIKYEKEVDGFRVHKRSISKEERLRIRRNLGNN